MWRNRNHNKCTKEHIENTNSTLTAPIELADKL